MTKRIPKWSGYPRANFTPLVIPGVVALWNGLSASVLRQMTYSMARFGIYETGKRMYNADSFHGKVAIAAFAGAAGGYIGTPTDLVNVRMQNDMKLPADSPLRRK